MLAQKWDSVPFWTTAEADFALNEGLRMWNLLTGMWKARTVYTTSAGTMWINVPSALALNLRIDFNEYTLDPASMAEMDSGYPGWEGQFTDAGGSVPTSPKNWIPAGLNLFAIWPGDATGSNSLVIDGVMTTPVLVNPGDYINMPPAELNALLGYALHVASFKDAARWAGTIQYYKDFLVAATKYNNYLTASALYRKIMGLNMDNSERPDGRYTQ